MNLYLVSRTDDGGYDTYDSFVCTAETEEVARHTYPSSYYRWFADEGWAMECVDGTLRGEGMFPGWVQPSKAEVLLLGTSILTEAKVICASFNAG